MRKHYLLSPENIETLDRLAQAERCSAAEVVRKAIEAYDAGQDDTALNALLDVVEESLVVAVKTTAATNRKISRILKRLES